MGQLSYFDLDFEPEEEEERDEEVLPGDTPEDPLVWDEEEEERDDK